MTRKLQPVPDTPPRAVIYVRVSEVGDRGDDLTSPELQERAARDYCARRGYVVVDVLTDLDRTGRSWTRRQVEGAVRRVEAGEVDVIVCWRWSRFTRNLRDYVIQTARIEQAGGRLEAALEEVDPATSAGLLQRDLFAILAQWESRKIGEQWKETHQRRRASGLPHGGGARFGYLRVDGQYVPDPETAPVVAELYRRYVAGEGLLSLVRWLNARGHTTTAGHPWSSARIGPFLDSGFAAGLLRRTKTTGEYLPGAHDAIIDRRLWEAYQLRRRAQATVPARVKEPRYELTGLIRCGLCEAPLTSAKSNGEPGYLYLCSKWHTSRQCTGVWVARRRAEGVVRQWLVDFAADIDARAAARSGRRRDLRIAQVDAQMAARQVAAIDRQLEKLLRSSLVDGVPESVVASTRDGLLIDRDEAQRLLEKAEAALAEPQPPRLPAGLLADWESLPVRRRRDILAAFLLAVKVFPKEPGTVGRPRIVPVERFKRD